MDDALFEIDNMCHALGFDPNEIRKGQRTYEYYRNFFVASGEYKDSWEKLVKWGDAATILVEVAVFVVYAFYSNKK